MLFDEFAFDYLHGNMKISFLLRLESFHGALEIIFHTIKIHLLMLMNCFTLLSY